MNRQIVHNMLGLMLLLSCNNYRSCTGIVNGKFSGYALAFYHKPVSGGNYEMFIIPVCDEDSAMLSGDLQANISRINLLSGFSYTVNINEGRFIEVFKKSKKFELTNNQSLAPQFREIFVCPLYVEFSGIQNDTESITGSIKKSLKKKLALENGKELTLDYILSNRTRANEVHTLE
jgi:hypothetical protein